MKTGKFLYNKMVVEGLSLPAIEKEYGITKHYIITRVYDYMKILQERKRHETRNKQS